MIREHLQQVPDTFLSLSGGKDSTLLAYLTSRISPDIPMCFYDSGLEFPENVEYIKLLASEYKWNLHHIQTGDILDLIVTRGWFNHYTEGRETSLSLKEVKIDLPSDLAHKHFGRGRLWGLRANESRGRSALLLPTRGITRYKNGYIACAPLWNWTGDEVQGTLTKHNIPTNPVYTKLTQLGVPEKEQRVGSYFDGGTDFGRITWLKRGWPDLYESLRTELPRLEEYK